MKLLLTSGGITNKSIEKALFDLTGKKPENTTLVFVPTASNMESGDKGWLIDDLVNLKKLNLKEVDIADISAVDKKVWLPKFQKADILFFEGGYTYHLMRWINKSGLTEILPELLKTKVYVGLSAGSMVTNPFLNLRIHQVVYNDYFDEKEDMQALNLVDFYFLPHLNSPHFASIREDKIKEAAQNIKNKIYALDDQSAIKVIDGKVEIISEGQWFSIN